MNIIHTFLEKRKIRKTLGKLVTPGTVESLLHDGDIKRQPLTPARIEFVLAFVRGDTPEEISERVGQVAGIATSHEAVVFNLVGPLAVVGFGTLRAVSPKPDSRSVLVGHLSRELADRVKIVHGAADGHYGLIGSESGGLAYGILLPRFDAMLGALSRLEFGQNEEFQ